LNEVQIILSENEKLAKANSKDSASISWLPPFLFACGQWYSSPAVRASSPRPLVVQNNWIIGNSAKKMRAVEWGHWFDDTACWDHSSSMLMPARPFEPHHVVFSTSANTSQHCSKLTEEDLWLAPANCTRAVIESITRAAWLNIERQTRGRLVFLDLAEKPIPQADGSAVLFQMFLYAKRHYPAAHTLTYVNSDILSNMSFVEGLDALVFHMSTRGQGRPFVAVGRRTNVAFDSLRSWSFSGALPGGDLFIPHAQDYFVFSANLVTPQFAELLPEFVAGRVGYDNWIVNFARSLHMQGRLHLVDATDVVPAVHLTSHMGNFESSRMPEEHRGYNHCQADAYSRRHNLSQKWHRFGKTYDCPLVLSRTTSRQGLQVKLRSRSQTSMHTQKTSLKEKLPPPAKCHQPNNQLQ